MNNKYKIGVVGAGMVGAPLIRYFSEIKNSKRGQDLFVYDKDLQKGYTDDINQADVIFVAVPTPRTPNGSANLTILESVFTAIKSGKTVVIKSTVPPGTTEYFSAKYPQLQVLFNPEFLTEQNAWQDFLKPTRQIVGFTKNHVQLAREVLKLLPKADFMSPSKSYNLNATEAELVKYGGNVYLTRKVNFANVLAGLSDKLGTNYDHVRAALGADHRIGPSHLDVSHAGYRGFGGYCFPKDLDAFIATLDASGLSESAKLLKQDREFNEKLLISQGLTLEDVSVHDDEWIGERLENFKHNKNG